MTQHADNSPNFQSMTVRGLSQDDPNEFPMIAAELNLDRLRSAVSKVNPELLTISDVRALLDLIVAASKSDSEYGKRMAAQDGAIEARNAEESR